MLKVGNFNHVKCGTIILIVLKEGFLAILKGHFLACLVPQIWFQDTNIRYSKRRLLFKDVEGETM